MSTYDDIQKDPFYRTNMAAMFGRWQKMAESDAFAAAFGAQSGEAKERLMDILHGMQDIYGANYVEDAKDGLKEGQKMKSFLSRKLPADNAAGRRNEQSFYDALKQVAKQNKVPMKTFFEDLHYMNEKLDLGLDMKKLDPELVVPKVKNLGEYNWTNYAKAHLIAPPYSPKQKQEYLAKAMAGAFLAGEKKRNPNAKETEFSKANAATMTKYIAEKPLFKKLCADRKTVDRLLAEGAKDPDRLFDDAVRIRRPFYKIGTEKCRGILQNLQKMQPLMDGADEYDAKWRALQESISSIDLTSNEPAKSGELKLQEILDKTADFMKGKKSLRKSEEHRNCFDQSLDVLAELAKGSPQAEAQAQVLVDRINEVRKGHDSKYQNIGIRSYGVNNVWKHSNSEDDKLIDDYYNGIKYKGGVKPKIRRYSRNVFEGYPMNDFSLLERVPKDINAKKVRRGARDLNEFLKAKDDKGNDYKMPLEDVKAHLAGILSLSDCKMYFREAKTIGHSDVVFDEDAYNAGIFPYVMDPAIGALARKYATLEARRQLSGGSEDVLDINIKQLKKDYADARKEYGEPDLPGQPEQEEPKKEGSKKPAGPQAGV